MSAVHYRVEFAEPRFITVERIGDPPGWSLRVDATEGLESLLPRGFVRALGDDLVLLFTEGEHTRTGAAYHHKIHRLTREGRLLWSLRTRPLGDPVLHGGYLLVPAAPVAGLLLRRSHGQSPLSPTVPDRRHGTHHERARPRR